MRNGYLCQILPMSNSASEFDMESEVLTVIYEGSRDLSLIQGGSSIVSASAQPP